MRNYCRRVEPFEVSVDHERFRISERLQPDGRLIYDIAWLNGPADGTYGFTVGRFVVAASETPEAGLARISQEQLVEEVRGFVQAFYGPEGIGEKDFPDHVPARIREIGDR